MSLATDILAELPALRAQAESLHTDTFTVLRRDGTTVTNPTTLVESPGYAVVHAAVAGKLQAGTTQTGNANVPGQVIAETVLQWHTSVNTRGVLTDDVVECTAIGPLSDPDLVGVRVRVVGPFLKSMATARRFQVERYS